MAKSNSLDERKNEDAFISGGEKNTENMTSGEGVNRGENLDASTQRLIKKQIEREERRRLREEERLEKEIERLEIRIHEIEEEMCMEEVLSDYIRLDALNEELIEAKENLTKNYQKWLN